MNWNTAVQEKFNAMIARMPVFHRRIAEAQTIKKAGELAERRGAALIEEQDVIGAFFSEVPKPFYSLMIKLLEDQGFDYRKYGFPK